MNSFKYRNHRATPDADWIHFGGGLHSTSALVNYEYV